MTDQIEKDMELCRKAFPDMNDPQLMADLQRGLGHRYSGNKDLAAVNTYLKDFGIPQIVLFDILANRFPLVMTAQRLVKQALLKAAAGSRHLCLIDFGIGRGLQVEGILAGLQEMEERPGRVTVVGIEISPEALGYTSARMESLKDTFGFTMDFIPVSAALETLELQNLKELIPAGADRVLANASLMLHHLRMPGERDAFFEMMRSIGPHLLTVIEPDADTFEDDFPLRLVNAYRHFTALYCYVNTLHLASDEISGLKRFFANDFFDPVAFEGELRFEKLETVAAWQGRAFGAGLRPVDLYTGSNGVIPEGMNMDEKQGALSFSFRGVDILGVMAFAI